MPDIKELMAIAAEKQKKKFSRGNRPDLLVDTGRSANTISEKFYSNGTNEETSIITNENGSKKGDTAPPAIDMVNSKIGDLESNKTQPSTTRHANSAQLDTPTQHNSTQELSINSGSELTKNNKVKSENIVNSAQLGTTQPFELYDKLDLSKKIMISESDEKNESFSALKQNLKTIDSAQLDTATQHNSAHKLGTINQISRSSSKEASSNSAQPSTTRHNSAPGPAQLGTQTRHNSISKNELIEIQSQIGNLSGTAAVILSFLSKKCIETGSNRVTISYRILSELTNLNFNSIPTTCKRLRNSGFFELSGPKGGAQAVRHFDLKDSIIRAFANEFLTSQFTSKAVLQPGTTQHVNPAQPDTWADTNHTSKLVNIINNNTTSAEETVYDGYDEIDVSVLKQFGVYQKQIFDVRNQLRKASIVFTASQMQGIVDRFAKYCSNKANVANIKNKPAFFCSAAVSIAKGDADPFSEVLSAADEALLSINKRRQEEMALKLRIDETIARTEFEHWKFDLTVTERKQLLGNLEAMNLSIERLDDQLFHHFHNFVWPDLRANFKEQIYSEMRNAEQSKKVQAEADIVQKAQTYLKDPAWVSKAAISHGLLGISNPEERTKKLDEIAKNLAKEF